MKKSILSLGRTLDKVEQQSIKGEGNMNCNHFAYCTTNYDCGPDDCILICVGGRCRAY